MADIAINPVTRRVQFTGNTGTGPFAFTFNILADADIAVYKNTTLLTLTTHYTVTTNANGTGSITLDAGQALISSDVLTIIGGRDLSRTTDFVTAGDLLASSLNEQLDSLVIMTQQLDEKVGRTIKTNPGDVYTDLELPTKDNRKGTVLGFNATSGDPEVGPTIADVSSLASITADIATLADIEDGTDATDAIQTVAGISSNVSTVAGISSNVTTVAGNTSNINAVAADATDIGTVAGSISNVNTVAGIDSNITTVAGNTTNINTVAGISSNVTTVAGISANVTTVAGISSNVTTVAGISSDVTTVAADGTDIGTVATNIADVNTVASNIATISAKVSKSGDTMTGDLTIQGNLTVSGTTITVDSASAQTVDLGDNDKIRLGDGDDLQIFHDGNHSKIVEAGTGVLEIQTNGSEIQLTGGSGTEYLARFINNGAFQAYYDNSAKLATTSTGIDVTGTVTADGLTVDGNVGIGGAASSIQSGFDTLQIGGNLTLNVDSTGAGAGVYMGNNVYRDSGNSRWEYIYTDEATQYLQANGEHIWRYAASGTANNAISWSEAMRISSTGSVGIGTSDPATLGGGSKLTVNQAADGNIVFARGGGTRQIQLGTTSTTAYINEDNASGGLAFHINGSEKARLDNSGNFGIGTSSPSYAVDTLSSGAIVAQFKRDAAGGASGGIRFGNNDKQFTLYGDSSNGLSIYDGATERMRIDSSGNLLVGLSSAEAVGTNAGTQLRADGLVYAAATSDAHILSRRSSDGAILNFRKDTTTVGSIGSYGSGSGMYLGAGDTGIAFNSTDDNVFPRNPSTNLPRDNAIDLGSSTARFKDLYLSGGVYLGGTGSANKLDDYEEGTCTLTMENTSTNCTVSNGNTFTGYYTKVGRQVTVHGYSSAKIITNAGAGGAKITGLPFGSLSGHYGVVSFAHTTAFTSDAHNGYVETNNGTQFYPTVPGSTNTAGWETGTVYFMFGLTYYTG